MKTKICLYGASSDIEYMISKLKEYNMPIYDLLGGIIDKRKEKWGEVICGLHVYQPSELREYDIAIITGSYFDSMAKDIKKINPEIVIFVFPYIYVMSVCEKNKDYEELKRINIEFVKNYSRCRELYSQNVITDRILRYHLLCRMVLPFELLPYEVCKGNQIDNDYFSQRMLEQLADVVFIDCGAYIGDTIIPLISKKESIFKKIYAIEPEQNNYNLLVDEVKRNGYNEKVICIKIGLGKEHKQVYFSNKQDCASKSKEKTCDVVQITMLDLLEIEDTASEYIVKMDVEGEELQVIQGAKQFIKEKRPILAVCVYHRFSDIWEIPEMINEICPEYKFYLRGGLHSFLLAIPNSRLNIINVIDEENT